MKSAIIGLAGAGKSTVFEALTGTAGGNRAENRIGTMQVPDLRVETLKGLYRPRKTVFAQVEYLLPAAVEGQDGPPGPSGLTAVRDCDALIHVVRNFSRYGVEPPMPESDFSRLDQELILTDLVQVEKRLERLTLDRQRGKGIDAEELELLQNCKRHLEAGAPLRRLAEVAAAPALRGFAFLSAKPMLVLFNNADEDESLPETTEVAETEKCLVIRGKLEQELAQMNPSETRQFLAEFDIAASALDRVIRCSYEHMGLISFFTVGEDEVRAWTIRAGTSALEAAGHIHSDMQKGFIRAEVLAYAALMEAGSYVEARKRGTVRLEGKTYAVCDGDIISFRFNV